MTPHEQAVAAEILALARGALGLEGEPVLQLGPDEPLAGRLDSLQLLALVVAVEDRFHVILSDDDAAGARTLADVARLVAARAEPDRLPAAVRVPAPSGGAAADPDPAREAS